MCKFVLGLDGGATKTQCAIFDLDGNMIDMINWGPTNHEVLKDGFEGLEMELKQLLNKFLTKNNMSTGNLSKCVFGMAGVDTKDEHRIVSKILRDIGINDFILCNDAYLGIKSGIQTGYGICVINGTGCTVVGIDSAGNMLQIGGLGSLTGDAGGGGTLGETAIRSAYNYLYRGGRYTRLVDLLYDEIGTNSKYEFIEMLTRKIRDRSLNLSELNKIIFKAADDDDEVALEILKNTGRELGISVNSMIRELKFSLDEPLNVVLAGSVNVKGSNPALVESLKEVVFQSNPEMDINFSILTIPPVAGSIIWAISEASGDTRLFDKVALQFEKISIT